jgi:hypothetical protein
MTVSWRILLTAILTAYLGLPGGPLRAKEKQPKAAAHPSAEPGHIHKQLAKLAGRYTTLTKFWAQPGADPMESKGTARFTAILGGRFLQEKGAGTMLGQAYHSLKLWGYNTEAGRFESTWLYTGSTAQMTLTGTSKDEGKTVDYTATVDGKKGSKMTLGVVTRRIDDDHFVVELSMKTPDGKKGPTMETTYTRKK